MRNIKFLPKTRLGKWPILLIATMFMFFYIGTLFVGFYESVPAGKTIPQDIIVRPGVALSMLAGFVSGIIAFITGIVAIIKKRERAILAFIATAIGALLILFLVSEIIFPH